MAHVRSSLDVPGTAVNHKSVQLQKRDTLKRAANESSWKHSLRLCSRSGCTIRDISVALYVLTHEWESIEQTRMDNSIRFAEVLVDFCVRASRSLLRPLRNLSMRLGRVTVAKVV